MIKRIASIAIAATLLCGCEGVGSKQVLGTLGGAAAGGWAGSQIGSGTGKLIATAAGVFFGALAGSGIGSSLDKADQMYIGQAQEQAFSAPVGSQVRWDNAANGNYGYVQPTRQGYDPHGNMCREFQQTIYVGGKAESAFGKACQQSDGSWRITG